MMKGRMTPSSQKVGNSSQRIGKGVKANAYRKEIKLYPLIDKLSFYIENHKGLLKITKRNK